MDLQIIKKMCENREGGLKGLAKDINMSEANLHRCINNNKIQATDLEKIASLLNVRVGVFFGETPNENDEIRALKEENRRLKEMKPLEKSSELYELCRELISNYKQRDCIIDKLVSMTEIK